MEIWCDVAGDIDEIVACPPLYGDEVNHHLALYVIPSVFGNSRTVELIRFIPETDRVTEDAGDPYLVMVRDDDGLMRYRAVAMFGTYPEAKRYVTDKCKMK